MLRHESQSRKAKDQHSHVAGSGTAATAGPVTLTSSSPIMKASPAWLSNLMVVEAVVAVQLPVTCLHTGG